MERGKQRARGRARQEDQFYGEVEHVGLQGAGQTERAITQGDTGMLTRDPTGAIAGRRNVRRAEGRAPREPVLTE